MVALSNTYEGGTNGTTITTGNSGGVSGNAFDNITIGTSATCTFSSTRAVHGAFSMSVSTAGTAAQTYAQWSTSLGSQTTLWGRTYLYLTGAPAANEVIAQFLNTATVLSNLRLLTTRALQVGDSVGGAVLTFTTVIPTNQWVRIEWAYTFPGSSTGQVTVKLFLNADSFSADESQTSAASQNFASLACNTVRYGWLQAVANSPQAFFDDVNTNTVGFAGPSAEFARPDTSFPPGLDPVQFAPWAGAPDASHDVIANAGTASISFRTPSPRYMLLLGLTSESGQSATVQTFNESAPLGVLLTPDDVTGGMQPWGGAPDAAQVSSNVTVNAGAASVSFTALPAGAGLGAQTGTAPVTVTVLAPVAGLGALPGAGSVTFTARTASVGLAVGTGTAAFTLTAQAPLSGAGAQAGAAPVTFAARTASTALGVLPGAAPVSFTGQTVTTAVGVQTGAAPFALAALSPTAALGALPGTAALTTTGLTDTAGLGVLPGAAPLAFTGQTATVTTAEDQQALLLPLFLPDDVTGGMQPWAGAPQGLVTGDTTVNAGVASVTVTALTPSTGLAAGTGTGAILLTAQAAASGLAVTTGTAAVALAARTATAGAGALPGTGAVALTARTASTGLTVTTGTAPVSFTAQSPSAASSGTATAGVATVTVTARSAAPGLGSVAGAAGVALSARTPAAGPGALAGTATVSLTAYDPTVVVPQAAHGVEISGREPSGAVSGREYTTPATGRESSAAVSGREPVSSRSGTEETDEISGRET